MIIEQAVAHTSTKIHSVQARAKGMDSFIRKAAKPNDENPSEPMYPNPLRDITDLAGVRVITFFPAAIKIVDGIIASQFKILERSDKGEKLLAEEKFGYNSIHYLVQLSDNRCSLPEYRKFSQLTAEVQVRTILQHAWAEIEHDIQYKSTSVIPAEIKRRFSSLAGMLEVADREFQAVQDEDQRLRERARDMIEKGETDQVEITPDALKTFLTQRIGRDQRISWSTYDLWARLLRKLGFDHLRQVEDCIDGYDDSILSKIVFDSRQGQIIRFELMLLAGMGVEFIERHPWAEDRGFCDSRRRALEDFKRKKIKIRNFDPKSGAK